MGYRAGYTDGDLPIDRFKAEEDGNFAAYRQQKGRVK
jgi:hypothetical protein